MKITYGKLKNSIEILKKIADLYLDFDLALKFYENIKLIDEKMEFYSSSLQKVIHKYAVKDENGNIVLDNTVSFGFQCQEAQREDMYLEVNQLEALELDIPLRMISKKALFEALNTLQKADADNPKLRFKVFDLLAIDYMLEN